MANTAGHDDEARQDREANGADPVEQGALPQPDPASFAPPVPDAEETAAAQAEYATAESPFLEALDALKEQLGYDPHSGLSQPAQTNGRYGLGNIVGFGIAEKEVDGYPTGMMSVAVYVITKVPAYLVEPEALAPELILGLPTDVVELGQERELGCTVKYRPMPAGVSIGPKPWGTWAMGGTAGCLLKRDSQIHILSNHHILLYPPGSAVGDPIFQPSLATGGNPSTDKIATLSHWVTLNPLPGINYVDCAMARVDDVDDVIPKIACLAESAGSIPWFTSSWRACRIGLVVYKCGCETGLTMGVIKDCNFESNVGGHYYEKQILIKPWGSSSSGSAFADNGDSGSVVYTRSGFNRREPVGLLKSLWGAGYGVASPFGAVLSGLGATMAFGLP